MECFFFPLKNFRSLTMDISNSASTTKFFIRFLLVDLLSCCTPRCNIPQVNAYKHIKIPCHLLEACIEDSHHTLKVFKVNIYTSALKSSLKIAKRLQLDQTKTAKAWTCSLGLSVVKLEDRKKTGCGGPVLSVETGLLYTYNYPSKHI